MSGSQGLTGRDVFLLFWLWGIAILLLFTIRMGIDERFDVLDAACGIEQVEEET